MTSPIQDKQPDVSPALLRAASGGDLEAVRSLLAAGANVDCANESGQTPLILAAVMGHRGVVAHLISAGADPRLRDRLDLTALEWSTRRGFADVTQFLTRVSPPLRKAPSEQTSESKKIESDTESSLPVASEAEAAILGAAAEPSTASSEKEVSAEEQTLTPQPELVETSASEDSSEAAAVATPLLSVEHAPAVVDSALEAEPAAAQLATESAVPLPSADEVAPVANETETEPVSAELATDSVTPLPSADEAPAVTANEFETDPVSAQLTTDSATPLHSADHAPDVVASEPEAELMSGQVATDYVAHLLSVDEASPVVANEAEAEPSSADLVMDPATPLPFDNAPDGVANEAQAELSAELPPTSISEPSSEIEEPVHTATSTSDQESFYPEPEAASLSARKPLLLHEEDETLPQRRAPAPVFDFSLPDEPPRATSVKTGVQAPGLQIPTPRNREPAFSGSTLGLANAKTDDREADVSNFKRCPRCGAVYQNSPLSFCTRDNATLISVNALHPLATPAQTSATPIAVWLLIAFVLGASGFAAYRLTERFYRQPESAPAEVKPIETPPVVKKPAFSVGGDLAGSEVSIPEPEYPSDLMEAGITGPITVRIRVNKNGRVISATTSNGDSRLRAAAVKAARSATFAPDKLAAISPRGRAVAGSITYDFAASQTNATTSPSTVSPTATTSPGASAVPASSATPNLDPDAPVVSNELMSAATNVPAADYPSRARRAGIGGAITVTIRVNRAGRVISWRTSAGDSQLRAAAIKAARKATFSREKLPGNGDVVGTITYNFTP